MLRFVPMRIDSHQHFWHYRAPSYPWITERMRILQRDYLPAELEPTHINLNDGTLEGMRHRKHPLFSVQYHPEAAAGPHDSTYLFEEFQKLMK